MLLFFDAAAHRRLDKLFGNVLISIVLGKFIGDYLAIIFTRQWGTDMGYLFGISLAIAAFIYWNRVELYLEDTFRRSSQRDSDTSSVTRSIPGETDDEVGESDGAGDSRE
jgi:hypothetical protein